MKYAYVRVSTDKQEYERQLYVLKDCGVPQENIFSETVSGTKKTDKRPQFEAMMSQIKEGDIVYFESMSRMSRSVMDMVMTTEKIVKKKKATVKFLKENLTMNDHTGSTENFIFNIFAAIAQLERDLISERTKEQIAAKRALLGDDFKIGRNSTYDEEDICAIMDLREADWTIRDIAEELQIPSSTVGRIVKKLEKGTEKART